MLNPKDVLTVQGQIAYAGYVFNLGEAIFFITNHADDLEIDEDVLDKFYAVQKLLDEKVL